MSVNLHESAQLFKPTSKKFMIWYHGNIINYTSYTTYIKHFLLLINNTLCKKGPGHTCIFICLAAIAS